jgi:phosphoglycolate phosphatase-like HAD superfamily hydrolase
MTTLSSLRALVLDFDGVLVESEGLKTKIFEQLFARYPEHAQTMWAFHQANIAASRYEKFEHLAYLLNVADKKKFVGALAVEFSDQSIGQTAACPEVLGASVFLSEFAPRLPLYLASITPESDLLKILERRQWRSFFVDVYGYPPRPKAQAVARAVTQAKTKEAVALIGDSPSDWRVAQEGGVEFIGRDSGIKFPDPHPHLYRDLTEIAQVVRSRL